MFLVSLRLSSTGLIILLSSVINTAASSDVLVVAVAVVVDLMTLLEFLANSQTALKINNTS